MISGTHTGGGYGSDPPKILVYASDIYISNAHTGRGVRGLSKIARATQAP